VNDSVAPDLRTVPDELVTTAAVPRHSRPYARSTGPPRRVNPRDAVELQLLQIWRDVLGVDGIGVTDDFFDVGGSSVYALVIVGLIRQRFRRRLALDVFFSAGTIEALAGLLRGGRRAARTCVVPIKVGGPRRPLFAVHTLAGTVMHYAPLANALGTDQPFYGLQATGIAGGALQRTVRAMARRYVSDMRAVQAEGPYQVCGYSAGGAIAWEMACQLAEAGQPTSALILIDAHPYSELPLDDSYWIDLLAHRFLGFCREAVDIARLPTDEVRIASLVEIAHRVCRVPPDYGPDEVRRIVRQHMSIAEALNVYRPRPYRGPALLIRTDAHPDGPDETRGWPAVDGGMRVVRSGADHFNVMGETQAPLIADAMRPHLHTEP